MKKLMAPSGDTIEEWGFNSKKVNNSTSPPPFYCPNLELTSCSCLHLKVNNDTFKVMPSFALIKVEFCCWATYKNGFSTVWAVRSCQWLTHVVSFLNYIQAKRKFTSLLQKFILQGHFTTPTMKGKHPKDFLIPRKLNSDCFVLYVLTMVLFQFQDE